MTDYKPHVTPDPILPPSLTHRDIMHLAPRLIASWRCVKRGGYPPTSVLWRVRSWALRPRLSPSVSVFYFRTGANAGSSYRANDFLPSHASPEKTEQWKLGGQWVQSARQTTQFTCFRLPHTHTHTHTRMQINCTDEWHENVASLWHALILLLVFTGRNISHRRGYVLSQVTYWFKQDAEALTTSFLGHFSIKVMQNNLFWRLSGSTLNLILFALSKGRGLFAQLSCWAFDQTDTMIMSVTETRADSLAKEKTPGCALTSSFRRGSIFSS